MLISPRHCRAAILAGMLIAWAGCSTVGRRADYFPNRTTLTADRVALPTSEGSGLLFVDVMINGAGPFHLMVDTGAGCLNVTQRVADLAGLHLLRGAKITVDGVNETVLGKLAWVKQLQSEGLVLEGLWAVVLTNNTVANSATLVGVPYDGFLGRAALRDLILEMDFPRKRVSVVKAGAESYPAERGVPWQMQGSLVTLDVAGKPVSVELDTGSNGGFCVPELDGFPLAYPKYQVSGTVASVGQAVAPRTAIGQLNGVIRLGPVTWVNPGLEGGSARVGVGKLAAWRLAIDFPKQRVYFLDGELERNWDLQAGRPVKFRPGFFAHVEGIHLRLLEIDAGAAADLAGLRVGDLILTVNGLPATSVKFAYNRETIPGPPLQLRVRRGGGEFETNLVLGPETSDAP